MIIDERFNRLHDWCENDSAYKSWLSFLLNAKYINVDVIF